jgi:hypothetical protein
MARVNYEEREEKAAERAEFKRSASGSFCAHNERKRLLWKDVIGLGVDPHPPHGDWITHHPHGSWSRPKKNDPEPATLEWYYEHLRSKAEKRSVVKIIRVEDLTESYRHLLPPEIISLDDAIQNSRSLLDLKDNWDDEGSVGYAESTWRRARNFLIRNAIRFFRSQNKCFDPPEILPGPHGSIDLHWMTDTRELLINVPARTEATIGYYGDNKADETEHAIRGKNIESTNPEWIFLWLSK